MTYAVSRQSSLRTASAAWLVVAAATVWVCTLISPPACAAPADPDALALLESHCVQCHGGEATKGGLDLVTRDGLLRGGDEGPAIIPGKPGESRLVRTIRHEVDPHMPKKAAKLPDSAVGTIEEWIKAGAPYSRAVNKSAKLASAPGEFTISAKDRAHWAFQPIHRPTPPSIDDAVLSRGNAIDRFVLAKLKSAGLSFSPEASKEVLIRRVTFDLIGLPPTPAEIDAFVADESPDAYEKLIDRLLASPHYGERWGRHWLDLARYAETDGFEHDAVRPHSWRYRDYVIRSFNADKPYDRFVREQLAGDLLWPDEPDAAIATGFNLLGPDMVDSSDQVQRRHITLNDMTDTAGLAFLGLTVGCARCHDHKFEPISQRDYYALQAFFTPANFVRDRPVATPEQRAAYEAAMKAYEAQPAVRELAAADAPVIERLRNAKVSKLAPEARVAHQTPPDQRSTDQANLVLETEEMIRVTEKEVAAATSGDALARRKALLEAVRKLPKPPAMPLAMALAEKKGAAAKAHVLHRGEYTQPGDEVHAAFPAVLTPQPTAPPSRVALAEWTASAANPLTARVMVNRIWRHHFGRALVATPSDFGTHGAKPFDPELLDYLAGAFIDGGWSIKRMHKLMLTSMTYRQSSAPVPAAKRLDPEERLYYRMRRLRLEGEVIRDALLAVSGRLNPQAGGPGVFPPIPQDIIKGAPGWTTSRDPRDHTRRSVYIFARRNLRFPFLEVFDAPDNNLSCSGRERSTTAPQALTLLNAEDVVAAARGMAARLAREAKTTDERIVLAYRLALGRRPTGEETGLSREFLRDAPLSELCRALFNVNEFVYLE